MIIGDGARWIWNWADDNYPGATQILDFYHAKEKLVILSNKQIRNEEEGKKWVADQSEKLLDDRIDEVIEIIKKVRCRSDETRQLKENTIN